MRGCYLPLLGDGKHLNGAVHVAEENAFAVGREEKPRVTNLAAAIRLQDIRGGGLGRGFPLAVIGEQDALANFSFFRFDDDQLARLACYHERFAIGRKGHGLGTHAGEFELFAVRSEDLVDRSDDDIISPAAYQVRGGFYGSFRRSFAAKGGRNGRKKQNRQ